MEAQRRKWINLTYLVVAALATFLFSTLALKAVVLLDLEARVRSVDMIVRLSALAVGALAFFLLYRNSKVNQFLDEVYLELGRVVWPTQKETTNSTVVVVIMVLIAGMTLGFLDYLCVRFMALVL